ncbi:DNA polymerase III subunit chi [Sphingomonas morindae]|uniref:DNA polymerase III subunit chi n=1 Tax=Sphingomonas morindae TaxID=1541170 RepID=A0ABY4X886_9SPHN|nr:DNA polymerase III subunit chi [Sphingomonas morindae]USI73127.1 DNA polymerase III subunit chi [Sphingomonas morindae]
MQVDFYQLGRSPLPRVLARIAERILADGGRLLIVAGSEAQAADLDAALWEGPDSFLPHGREGADQPVLIGLECTAANQARHIALADQRWRDEALAFDRAFHFFDADTLEAARAAWRALGARPEISRNYWSQDEAGRWRKTA